MRRLSCAEVRKIRCVSKYDIETASRKGRNAESGKRKWNEHSQKHHPLADIRLEDHHLSNFLTSKQHENNAVWSHTRINMGSRPQAFFSTNRNQTQLRTSVDRWLALFWKRYRRHQDKTEVRSLLVNNAAYYPYHKLGLFYLSLFKTGQTGCVRELDHLVKNHKCGSQYPFSAVPNFWASNGWKCADNEKSTKYISL